jgi:predicted glycoside hydrolase/deacetylase ChbG (UPF0249 family)
LGREGLVTSTVLLVTSPYASEAVQAWRDAGRPVELGWHPCLTLDRPVLPASRVPTLVDSEGRFRPLGKFLRRLYLRQIRNDEMEAELRAQLVRFCDWIGHEPTVVNAHHHIQVFARVGRILDKLFAESGAKPFVRCVRESWTTLALVPGGRCKRALLSYLGRRQVWDGGRANDMLAGITNPEYVRDADFLMRWLRRAPGQVVELACHPGHADDTLLGRDCPAQDDQFFRRPRELALLRDARFAKACRHAGFTLVSPSQLRSILSGGEAHAA